MCLPQQDEEEQKLLPVFGSTVFTLYVAVKSVAIQYSHWEGYSKGICGICAIKVTATDTPLMFPMHHQHLRILTYLFIFFYFLPPQLSGMQKSWLLFLAFLFAQHANTPFSSIFVPCLLVQPTVTQPCQNRPNCSSTGAQQAEEGDKEAGFTLVALSNLCWHHCPEEGRRKRPVRLKESSLVLGAPPSI